ncbi:MAG: hypothetical protein AAFQ37_03370, partial [Bacteroidota bacterium]
MLEQEGSKYIGRFSELKYLLAPYLVRSAEEQREFYGLWDEFAAECEKVLQDTTELEAEEQKRTPVRYYIFYFLLLAGLASLGIVGYFTGAESKFTAVGIGSDNTIQWRRGDTLALYNLTRLGPFTEDSSKFHWQIRDRNTGSLLHETNDFALNWPINTDTTHFIAITLTATGELETGLTEPAADTFNTAIYCTDPPDISNAEFPVGPYLMGEDYVFRVPSPQPNVLYTWSFSPQEELKGHEVSYRFEREGNTTIGLLARDAMDSTLCYSSHIENRVVGNDKPFVAALPLIKDRPRQLLKIAPWVWWTLLGLFFLPSIIRYFLLQRHRRKTVPVEKTEEELLAEYPVFDNGPYDIPFHSQAGQISAPADFFRIADQLRIREAGLRRVFDPKETVNATIQGGGFPVWRDRPVKRPANYLLLLRHTDERNQQDRLLKRLTDFLKEQEAALTVYYHSGSFDNFWNNDFPDGWNLDRLYARYPEHRLIILGDAHGLIDPYESRQPRLDPASQSVMLRWDRRLLLTTEPTVDWSYQEALLHQYFLLYPITSEGISEGIFELNETEEYEPSDYLLYEEQAIRKYPEPSHRYCRWETIAEHEAYLVDDPELFRWLKALAVCAQPDWDLTIVIGRALGIDVTHNRLLRLSRIPWLANNQPDNDLRLAFLEQLSEDDESIARQAILTELEAVAPTVKDSFAQTAWTADRAVQRFTLAPEKTENKQAIRDLRELGFLSNDQLAELDHKASRKLKSSATAELAIEVTPNLDKWLDTPEPESGLRPFYFFSGLLFLALLVTTISAFLFNRSGKEFLPEDRLALWQRTRKLD